jgi:hypothetical protein
MHADPIGRPLVCVQLASGMRRAKQSTTQQVRRSPDATSVCAAVPQAN